MSTLEKQVALLVKLALAEDDEKPLLLEELKRLAEKSVPKRELDSEVRRLLAELGISDHLAGHPYLVQAVMLATEDPKWLKGVTITGGLYSTIANNFGTAPTRVERAIRGCIEFAWEHCSTDTLYRYFANIVCLEKGKPTNLQFIARGANIVRDRMK